LLFVCVSTTKKKTPPPPPFFEKILPWFGRF
jgi:hypothetical protein